MRSRGAPLTTAGTVDGQYWLPPWIYPPAEFTPIELSNWILLPAVAASANILSVQIPQGHNGIITHIANILTAGGFNDGAGTVTWQIARDKAAVDGYGIILGSLGVVNNPTRLPSGFRVFENQIITLSVSNVGLAGGPYITGGRFMGWYYPKEYEDPNIQTM